jgi:hypothetical protein
MLDHTRNLLGAAVAPITASLLSTAFAAAEGETAEQRKARLKRERDRRYRQNRKARQQRTESLDWLIDRGVPQLA